MNIAPQDLLRHLKQQQKRNTFVYLVTGDEVLLVEESIQLISTQARTEGYTERWVIETDTADSIDLFLSHTQNLSFLSLKKLIEVRFPQKVTAAWSALFMEILNRPDPNQIIIIRTPKLSRAETQVQWYKKLDQAGCIVTIWPLKQEAFFRWLQARIDNAGMKIQKESISRIASSTEGNLLAASQVIEKLQLIYGQSGSVIPDEAIHEALSDQTHFNVFELCDAILTQNPVHSLKILSTLKNQGTEPPIVLWALMQEVKNLAVLSTASPQSRSALYPKRNIWGPRQALFQKLLPKITSVKPFIQQGRHIDELIKGLQTGDVWMELEILCLNLSRIEK